MCEVNTLIIEIFCMFLLIRFSLRTEILKMFFGRQNNNFKKQNFVEKVTKKIFTQLIKINKINRQ
jgi:hypothetical protein